MVGESEQFQKVLAAALRLSVVDKLRLIARIADSLADDMEKPERSGPERRISLQGIINENHQLVVQMPDGFPPCEVTVVLEWPAGTELKDTTADQLKITIQLPNTEAIRQWFTDYQRKQGTSR
jgi:hypothetical protein